MAVSAYRETGGAAGEGVQGGVPADLMMDLLVDAELPEVQRAALLRKLEMTGEAGWKELSLRFLQRQVEKETVRQLMAGGTLVPVEMTPPPPVYKFPLVRWLKSTSVMATAAGLLIATTSALITLYVARMPSDGNGSVAQFHAIVPGSAIGEVESIPVSVPLLKNTHETGSNLFPASFNGNSDDGVARRTVVIQMDANGNMVAIPVNTMQMKVW